ncbi:MAG: hypothetical protein QM763_08395 [Agriterribacter sp.]
MKRGKYLVIILMLVSAACKKIPSQQINDYQPAITTVGIPNGDAVTKEIGAAGGSISSADGNIDVIIPAGAVNVNTPFSIQPITNNCPGGLNAYRLLPSGITFPNPVIISFKYTGEETDGSLPELLGIAFQDKSGIWYRIPSANIDTVAKTISVKAKHFTDWSKLSRLAITPRGNLSVKIKKSLTLTVTGAPDAGTALKPDNPTPGDEDLPPLPLPTPFNAEWFVNKVKGGDGVIGTILNGNATTTTYTAPEKVPSPSVVSAQAQLTGFTWKAKIMGQEMVFNKVVLPKRIKINGEEKKFAVTLRYIKDTCVGIPGLRYVDSVSMIIHVSPDAKPDSVVFATDIENHAPGSLPNPFLYKGCFLHEFIPETYGTINFTSAKGRVFRESLGSGAYNDMVEVDMANDNTAAPRWRITNSCNPGGPLTYIRGGDFNGSPIKYPDGVLKFYFPLTQSTTQTHQSYHPYISYTVQPL